MLCLSHQSLQNRTWLAMRSGVMHNGRSMVLARLHPPACAATANPHPRPEALLQSMHAMCFRVTQGLVHGPAQAAPPSMGIACKTPPTA